MENNNIDKTFNEASKTLEEPATFPGFDKVWAKVEEKLDKKEEKKSRLITMLLPYGIAASLLIGSGIFYFNNKKENTEITTPAIAKNTIKSQSKNIENSTPVPENIQKIDSTVKANIQSEVFATPIPKIAYHSAPKMYIEAPQAAPVFEKAVETSDDLREIMNSGRASMDTLKRSNIEEVIAMGIKKEKANSASSTVIPDLAFAKRKKISELNVIADTAEVSYPIAFNDKGQAQEPEILGYNKSNIKKANSIAMNSGFANRVGEKMAFNSLSGKVSGININPISGAPGSGKVEISLHCQGSTTNTGPLYIVDGVVTDAEVFKKIDVKKIVGMNIFKGEKAVSLFGNRAINGAIVVETKDISKKEKRKLKRLIKKELPKK
ncbi:hypothetical protein [Chryseobacterium sp. MMS23-Vi53]|uniref:hypothetical protein n=1 Tax=Chryseobacterium sp. MMS23-Vi53 TaxID=3386644 RepID=UPI0039EB220D